MAILGDKARVRRVLHAPTYSFLRTIDEGSAAETKLYEHTVLGGLRVQKSISVLGLPDGVARSEPRLLESMDHPHLIKVRDAQWDPDYDDSLKVITFTTDYYEGQSIHAALNEGHAFGTADAVAIIDCVLDGLHYLHVSAGVVHRDIKPGNVMLNAARNQGFVGDFGSAAYLDADSQKVDASGGTLLYRPPEYSSGLLDVRSDLYSTGLTMFELLNGPFDYQALDGTVLLQRAEAGKPALTPRHLRFQPWVSPSLVTFVRRLMATKPESRFASADEALRSLRGLRYVDWTPVSSAEWIGKWPPRQVSARQRLLRVSSEHLGGRNVGHVSVTAATSIDGGRTWRNYARFARRVPEVEGAEGLALVFRDVEAAAQSVATR
ncbi:serine/threonine-protein kinase [Curtobacterium sp. RHCKG23]|uniref:non-specific serine/threonine protein kinase n=1 Tax=Curtobacterium citri TaxID=3055139 RepID=A0ABT7T594_9MICO|nr:serine/threonine-protein kinase [Curtobacterium citri]MDM7884739.1 serine/threonine-protein kinase [Curtobacterium citri]